MNVVWTRRSLARVLFLCLCLASSWIDIDASTAKPSVGIVKPNDNRHSAGTFISGTLTLTLRAAPGRWQPEGPGGPTLEIEAFGEVGQALMVPAPLIRVTEGTEIAASIRNDLDAVLVVHGLCTRGGASCPPLQVPPRQTGKVRFASGVAGTYHYWASTIGAPVPFRELAGAFVVDPVATAREQDRILVITEWTSLTPQQLGEIVSADDATEVFVAMKPRFTFVINGLSWPETERFTYDVGEHVRWRVINLSSQPHPLHLHGFYFDVDSLGNGVRDTVFDAAHRRRVVTQLLPSGGTMTMTWTPERAGNWLFHCHVMHHVSLERRLTEGEAHDHHEGSGDRAAGMAGMVIGVSVRERPAASAPAINTAALRQLTLSLEPAPRPLVVLQRNEPVEITLVNRLAEPTSIHWHGIELDSYYDGVHGFSGVDRRVTPMIAPGASFVVRMTPPRAGTFIYHTHLHDYRQLSSGLYGPLIVTEPGEKVDPDFDHVIVLGRGGLSSPEASLLTEPDSVLINGERAPRLVWKGSARHRVRIINITPDDVFSVSLQTSEGPVQWTPVAKDGVPLPSVESVPVAARQTIAVGETYDFEYQTPPARRSLWMEVRTPGGKWQAQARVIIK